MRSRWRDISPRAGRDGKDPDPAVVETLVAQAVASALAGVSTSRHVHVEHVHPPGPVIEVRAVPERGPRGPVGPMPAHRWRGTRLQFEQAPGNEWGDEVDLQGPRGEQGANGAGGGIVTISQGGGGSSGWFPGGW